MSSDELELVAKRLGGDLGKGMHTTVVTVAKTEVKEACAAVAALPGFYHLSTITAVDVGDRIELLYHFWKGRTFVAIKTELTKDDLAIESVSSSLASATLYEAEIHDLFGVTFTGNPYTGKRLLLPDDYPKDAPPPLRTEAEPEKIRKMMKLE